MKLQHKHHCSLKGITKKPIYFLFDRTFLFESNITLQKTSFQSYLHLGKYTENLFLQCENFKLMHNNV
jgi:hypothetical protein